MDSETSSFLLEESESSKIQEESESSKFHQPHEADQVADPERVSDPEWQQEREEQNLHEDLNQPEVAPNRNPKPCFSLSSVRRNKRSTQVERMDSENSSFLLEGNEPSKMQESHAPLPDQVDDPEGLPNHEWQQGYRGELHHPAEPNRSPNTPQNGRCVWCAIGFYIVAVPVIFFALGVFVRRQVMDARLLLLTDGANCQQGTDCASGKCALSGTIGSNSSLICCPFGSTNGYDDNGALVRVCTKMPEGTSCGSIDAICDGFCINGLCVSDTLRVGDRCDRGKDCEYGGCARSEAFLESPTVCCSEEGSLLVRGNSTNGSEVSVEVCKSLPVGAFCSEEGSLCDSGLCIGSYCVSSALPDFEPCSQNNHCQNRVCGLATTGERNETICCPSGARTIVFDSSNNGNNEMMCAQMPKSTRCHDTDAICESGICINGLCADRLLRKDELCDESTHCESGACAISHVAPGTFLLDSPTVCCANEGSLLTQVAMSSNGTNTFLVSVNMCKSLPFGAFCNDEDTLCANGLCINDMCASTYLEDFQACSHSNHCQNGVCALAATGTTNERVCCPDGASTVLFGSANNSGISEVMCAQMPQNTKCYDMDAICESGNCVNGLCADNLLQQGEVCDNSSNCETGTCAIGFVENSAPGEVLLDSPTVCCTGEGSLLTRVPMSVNGTDSRLVPVNMCTSLPLGAFCNNEGLLCASGLCIDNVCVSSALSDFQTCSQSNHCQSEVCGLATINNSNQTICCPDGASTILLEPNNNRELMCAQMPRNSNCYGVDSICESGICIGDVCVDELRRQNELCGGNSDCESGTCALGSASSAAPFVCCSTRETTGFVDSDGVSMIICNDRPASTVCNGLDSICSDGLACIEGVCSNLLLDNEPLALPAGLRLAADKPLVLSSLGSSGLVRWPVSVQVRTIWLLYFGLDDTDISDNDIDRAGNLTCELMTDHLRAESFDTHECDVLSIQPGPVLSYSLAVNVPSSSIVSEDEVHALLESFFMNRQDAIVESLSKLPSSNIFQQTTKVVMKFGLE